MKMEEMLNKEATAVSAEGTLPVAERTFKTMPVRNIPRAEIDLVDVAKRVSESWMNNPVITLAWKNPREFDAEVQKYATLITYGKSTGSMIPAHALTLRQMDFRTNDAIKEVKMYIGKKFKTINAVSQYMRYGITRVGSSYRMITGRNGRREAMKLTIAAIEADGFGGEEYGSKFWNDLLAAYSEKLDATGNTRGSLSSNVATKAILRKSIKKTLGSLLLAIRANYPDTYRGEYRNWGWQKESY